MRKKEKKKMKKKKKQIKAKPMITNIHAPLKEAESAKTNPMMPCNDNFHHQIHLHMPSKDREALTRARI
jgi:hypothetical protein